MKPPTLSLALLAMLASTVAAAPVRAAEPLSLPVSFETEDGFTLHGQLTSAGTTESPIAILLHMYRHDRSSWAPLVPELVGKGITVLALDQRTHGESIQQGDTTRRVADIPRDAFGQVVRAGPKDVAAARAYLEQQGFDVSRLALVGASYGCTVALLSAGTDGLKGLVLLSPGTAYFGVDVTQTARMTMVPILAVAAEDDPNAELAARTLTDQRRAISELTIFPAGGHGTRLFDAHPKLAVEIREFLRQSFGMAPRD